MSEIYREYQPHEWERNEPITADKLNNIEQGINAIDDWVQGTSATGVTFTDGTNIGAVTINGRATMLQVPPSSKTAITVNPIYQQGPSIATLTIDGIDTEIHVPPDEDNPLILHEMTAEDTEVTIDQLPNTYEWPAMESLTISLYNPTPEKEYHFIFSTGNAPTVTLYGCTSVVGTIQPNKTYEVDIWNLIAVVLDCTESSDTPGETANTKSKTFTNVSVPTSAWTSISSTSDTYYLAGYRYYADIAANGVDGNYIPFVNFDVATALSGNMAPTAVCDTNKVRIWAIESPSAAMTIPTIMCLKS